MQSPHIPIVILRDLLCGHCRKFVTCGPVYITPDSHLLCGRCVRVAKKIYRNLAFEAVASVYSFPCYYWPQHCNQQLAWNEALVHESDCYYQSSCCCFCCCKPSLLCKSDRKLPNNTEVSPVQVKDELLESLKCVSCELYLSSTPVFIVIDGKNICHRCSYSNGAPKGAVRNLAYENIAVGLIFPCIYRYRGCELKFRFGKEVWRHEYECAFGRRMFKKTSKAGDKPAKDRVDKPEKVGKERGVIQTHSGHVYGTITPNSALFAPPSSKSIDNIIVTKELEIKMKKKHQEDEARNLEDSQSMDSVMSKGTFDSMDSIAGSVDYVSVVSRDEVSRSSSRGSQRPERNGNYRVLAGYQRPGGASPEILPSPTPIGFNKLPFNGHYQENVDVYGRPLFLDGQPQFYQFGSANYGPDYNPVMKNNSYMMGNKNIIDELKARQSIKPEKKEQNPYEECNNLQDIVQLHDQVFSDDSVKIKAKQ